MSAIVFLIAWAIVATVALAYVAWRLVVTGRELKDSYVCRFSERDMYEEIIESKDQECDFWRGEFDKLSKEFPSMSCKHCAKCGHSLAWDTALHILTADGPVCGKCREKLNEKEMCGGKQN